MGALARQRNGNFRLRSAALMIEDGPAPFASKGAVFDIASILLLMRLMCVFRSRGNKVTSGRPVPSCRYESVAHVRISAQMLLTR